MSIDFAMFNLTELAVLDATDAVGLPEMGASALAAYVEDLDDLLGTETVAASSCCSSTCSSSSCC